MTGLPQERGGARRATRLRGDAWYGIGLVAAAALGLGAAAALIAFLVAVVG